MNNSAKTYIEPPEFIPNILGNSVEKEKYKDDFSTADEFVGWNDDLEEDDDFEEHEIIIPGEEAWTETIWNIPRTNVSIWDIWIEFEIMDFSKYIMNPLAYGSISIRINTLEIIQMPLLVNLFLTELQNKKIVITDTSIKIPIDFFALSSEKKFPLYLVTDGNIDITLNIRDFMTRTLSFETGKRILRYKSQIRKNNKGTSDQVIGHHPIHYTIVEAEKKIFVTGVDNDFSYFVPSGMQHFLIFNIDACGMNPSIEVPYLSQIRIIKGDGTPPIVFRDELDEIMSFTIMEKKYYAISLCPEFKNMESIKNYLKIKHASDLSGLELEPKIGLGAMAFACSIIEFDLDENLGKSIHLVYCIHTRHLVFSFGTVGIQCI